MRKEVDPELYNYNKYPGPEFVQMDKVIEAPDLTFYLTVNHKDAFDPKVFSQRYSAILSKFDYIVGDWGNEQLRLRGFYKDSREEAHESKISRLDDYLLEYCNFGCAYFVLENPQPKRAAFDKKSRRKKEDSGKGKKSDFVGMDKKRKKSKEKVDKKTLFKKKKHASKRQGNEGKQGSVDPKRHFVIRKKED